MAENTRDRSVSVVQLETYLENRIEEMDKGVPRVRAALEMAFALLKTQLNRIGHIAVRLRIAICPGAVYLAVALVLLACGGDDYVHPDAPRFVANKAQVAPRIAYALGSGGPRGFAHIGVLKVLEAEGIRPDLIAGSSAGALLGSLAAGGFDALELERIALSLTAFDVADLGLVTERTLRGTGLQDYVNRLLDQRAIQDLRIPIIIVSTERASGALARFNWGNTGVAVRASSAIPGTFLPARINGVDYVDGDLSSPIPIRVARATGARIVIAVDVSQDTDRAPPPAWAPPEWTAEAVSRRSIIAQEVPHADVVIAPPLPYLVQFNVEYRKMAISVGEAAAREALPKVRAAIAGQSKTLAAPR